jgi:hypothetical protein
MANPLLRSCLLVFVTLLAAASASCKRCGEGGVYCEVGYQCVSGTCQPGGPVHDAGTDLDHDVAGLPDGGPGDTGPDLAAPDLAAPDVAAPDLPPMIPIPGGVAPSGATVQPFMLDRTEVTVAAYQAAGGSPTVCPGTNFGVAGTEQHPINCADFSQATAHCTLLGKRLPTEDELEWAASSTSLDATYPWGEATPTDIDFPEFLCWSGGQGGNRTGTCPAGMFSPQGDSREGVQDLAGNVWEWTSSGGDQGRAIHGGGWTSTEYIDVAAISNVDLLPNMRMNDVGFRCAQ